MKRYEELNKRMVSAMFKSATPSAATGAATAVGSADGAGVKDDEPELDKDLYQTLLHGGDILPEP